MNPGPHFTMETKAVLQMIFDIVAVILLFRPLARQAKQLHRVIISSAALLLTAPLYLLTPIDQIYRILIRLAVYFISLTILDPRDHLRNAYLSALTTVTFTAAQNVFFSPLLVNFYRGTEFFTGVRSVDTAIGLLIQWAVYALFFFYIHKMIKIDKLHHIEAVEWMVLAFSFATAFYIKQALPTATSKEGEHIELTVFSVILNIAVIAFLGSFERYTHEKRRSEEMRLQEAMNQAYFKNLDLKKQRDEDVRRLHHDMKNHLLAIEKMSEGGSERVNEYIVSLIGELEPYEKIVETGNELLNGILSEKLATAKLKNISLEIQADCSRIGFVSDTDLCTIFGNALDNAIEACEKVEPAEDRVIRVKSEALAGQEFITVTNSCVGTVDVRGGIPLTTKKDKNLHGIGIRSMKRTLEKYNGDLHMKTENGRFTLTVIIPFEQDAPSKTVPQ